MTTTLYSSLSKQKDGDGSRLHSSGWFQDVNGHLLYTVAYSVSWDARKNKNKNPFLCVSNNEISFGSSRHSREEALNSPFLHTDVSTIHAYIHTELDYVHTQKKDTIKSSTMKKLNPPYPFVQVCRINMCKKSQHWNGFHWGRSRLSVFMFQYRFSVGSSLNSHITRKHNFSPVQYRCLK